MAPFEKLTWMYTETSSDEILVIVVSWFLPKENLESF